MAWTHNDEDNTIRCVSVKHDRDLIIRLPRSGDQAVYCRECWRNCLFWVLPPDLLAQANRAATIAGESPVTPRLMHYFTPSKPQ